MSLDRERCNIGYLGDFEVTDTALVLLSGGMDSAVALYWARDRGWNLHGLEFEYHERPDRERRACRALLQEAVVQSSTVVPIGFLRETVDLPESVNPTLRQAPEGYIPCRNLVFYALSAYYAEITNARFIVGGHNLTDSRSFPDASGAFFKQLNSLYALAMWSFHTTQTEVLLPLIELGKPDVVRLGVRLKVPFEHTWSCYYHADRPCGRCESCRERAEAFAETGILDPLIPLSKGPKMTHDGF